VADNHIWSRFTRWCAQHGPGWPTVSDGVARDEGWPLYVQRYAVLLTEDR
jgi:hypothetical protein